MQLGQSSPQRRRWRILGGLGVLLSALLLAGLSFGIPDAGGCGGGPTLESTDSQVDDLTDATLSMAMVRDNPSLAPSVVVPDGKRVAGRRRPLESVLGTYRPNNVWDVSNPGAGWLYDANGLNQFKKLADPKMDSDGSKVGAYARKPGDLYASDGVLKWDNVEQGYLGDCYFVASLAAVLFADKSGAWAKAAVAPNTVAGKVVSYYAFFYQANGRKVRIEVDPDLPHTNASGHVLYARSTDNQAGYEEWAPSLIEKGYATWHKSYTGISGGTAADALFALTGKSSRSYSPTAASTVTAIDTAGKKGRAQVACTYGEHDGVKYDGTGVYADHCYSLRGVAKKGGKTFIQLRNPWGPTTSTTEPSEPPDDGVQDGIFDLELSKFQTLYASVDILP
jgi:hypothetical protein